MYRLPFIFLFEIIFFFLTACNGLTQTEQQALSDSDTAPFMPPFKHCVYADDTSELCRCPAEYELKDSIQLTHIKDQFYKGKTGHLYEKTMATKEVQGQDTLVDVTYFNGHFAQEVDPLTFEPLDGWYAKDKNYVYYYRPVSGGMHISKIDAADSKTFKLLSGHYKYAMDKNNFYDEPQIIKGFSPKKTNLKLDNKGSVIAMTCNNKTYEFEIVE